MRIRYVVEVALVLTCAVSAGPSLGGEAIPPPEPARVVRPLGELVLDDFEAATARSSVRYGELEPDRSQKLRNGLPWKRTRCQRSGSRGHCLALRYSFTALEDRDITFRIDLGDVDASDYDHLQLWIKGDEASGFNESLKVGFRRPKPGVPGLMEDGTAVVTGITREWQRILIPLNRMSGIQDWTHLRTFFLSLEPRRATAKRGAYIIDDVVLLRTGRRGPSVTDEVVPAKKQAWEESLGGPQAAQPHVQQRLTGWPHRLLEDKQSLPREQREFLTKLARDTWRGLDSLTDRQNGLPIDHVAFAKTSLAPPDYRIGDYTSGTNVGLRFLSIVAAHDLGFLSAGEAAERIDTLLGTLERLETFRGFFFNFYDTTTLERTSNFVSFVDSSWLTAGLMVVRMTFPALRERCTKIIEAGHYGFFYDDVKQQMSHGYYVNVPTRSEYHYGVLYTEARLGSLIAIGKGDVPEEHWFRLARTLPAESIWQTQTPRMRQIKKVRDHRFKDGYYQWRGLKYVPSWGGSMFEALMPTLVLDERRYAPKNLGRNDEVHTRIQRRYAAEVLGYPIWGISPSATPGRDGYAEYGVKVLGAIGYPSGAVTPYAAALALDTMPEAATANLQKLAELYDIYGEYGFYDAVDPRSREIAYEYLALDQAMILIATANALEGHCIQKRFASDPIIEKALPIIGDEDFFD